MRNPQELEEMLRIINNEILKAQSQLKKLFLTTLICKTY